MITCVYNTLLNLKLAFLGMIKVRNFHEMENYQLQ